MTRLHKFSLKKNGFAFVTIVLLVAITWKSEARYTGWTGIYSTLTTDTVPRTPRKNPPSPRAAVDSAVRAPTRTDTARRDSLLRTDTIPPSPRTDTFSLKLSKDTLDAPVAYEAEDSAVLLVREKKFILYGKTKTTYKDITLTAPRLLMDQETNVVTAFNSRDSLGRVETRARFTQGSESFESDTITYNFKTQKGLTTNTYTRSGGEMWVNGGVIKKVDNTTSFARDVVMTTCDYDDPHFGFRTKRAKFVTNKVAITGPIHPEFEGVPIPFYLPFGFFPLNPGRHSGLLPPRFEVHQQYGIGLADLGYYQVLNDYLDVTVRTSVYSYGGWRASLTPTYRKRYKYSGTFNISTDYFKQAFKGDPDFSETRTFQVGWTHQMDSKAKPGTSFSAHVDISSSNFNAYTPNNPVRNVMNNQASSITYSKTWADKPFNLTMSANQSQNSNLHLMQFLLPDVAFSVNTIYPFQRKEVVGKQRWYEKIGFGYNGAARSQFAFYDTADNAFSKILDTLQWNAQHRVPITMSLPPLGPIIVSPSISYEQTWIQQRLIQSYNIPLQKFDTVSLTKGLFVDQRMSFGLGVNTAIYGTMGFRKGKIAAIRHVIRPFFNISYSPNLSKQYYNEVTLANGNKQRLGQLTGGYGYGEFGGSSFGIDNNLEMKWRGKTADGRDTVKKIRLIDRLGITSAYNFLKDSMKLDPFQLSMSSTLFEKINLTASSTYNPYKIDTVSNQQYNKFVWEDGRGVNPGFTYLTIGLSTQFRSKPRDPGVAPNPASQLGRRVATDPMLAADRQRLQEYMLRNPAEFVDFNIPWSFDLNFSLNWAKNYDAGKKGFNTDLSASINFNNSFSLTPKWNFSTNGYIDLKTKELANFSMSISRDMHCWQMSIQVVPLGFQRFFNITISPKSALLQDLRINRTRSFIDY